jgi:hypothetical protein
MTTNPLTSHLNLPNEKQLRFSFNTDRETINATRNEYYWLSRRRRQLLTSILNLWRQLKQLRVRQGFVSTTCKLIIQKIDNGTKQRHWDEEIDRQIEEHRQLFHEQLQQSRDTYRQKFSEWKSRRKQVIHQFVHQNRLNEFIS